MIVQVSFDPKNVVGSGEGFILVKVDNRAPTGFPLWLTTRDGETQEEFFAQGNEPKDARYVLISQRGTISAGKRYDPE